MSSPRDRYHQDPAFHQLVDVMVSCIMKCEYTPSEMREAAILASIIYEEHRIRKYIIPLEDVEQALNVIHSWSRNEPLR